eukprot:7633698-Pyramimonas_sp.AAC.1
MPKSSTRYRILAPAVNRTRLFILHRLAVPTSSVADLKLELCSENRQRASRSLKTANPARVLFD